MEQNLIKSYNCPYCEAQGTISDETLTQIAAQPLVEAGKLDKDAPLSAHKIGIPIQDPTRTGGLTVTVLLIEQDYCATCGLEYTVRASTMEAPVTMQQVPPPGYPPQRPFGMPPGSGMG